MKYFALCALIALAGCGDAEPEITLVERKKQFVVDQLWTWKDSRGLPVEIHGTPFTRTSDHALATALLQPNRETGDLSFYAAPTGSWTRGHSSRLVLHFNPQGDPDPYNDCKLRSEASTNPRPETGLTVHVTFCRQDKWLAHANLVAPNIADGDLKAFGEIMQKLMLKIFATDPAQ